MPYPQTLQDVYEGRIARGPATSASFNPRAMPSDTPIEPCVSPQEILSGPAYVTTEYPLPQPFVPAVVRTEEAFTADPWRALLEAEPAHARPYPTEVPAPFPPYRPPASFVPLPHCSEVSPASPPLDIAAIHEAAGVPVSAAHWRYSESAARPFPRF